MNDKTTDDVLELIGAVIERVKVLEDKPPAGSWARSVAWLIDRYVTRRNVLWVAGTLAAAWVTIQTTLNGVPLT